MPEETSIRELETAASVSKEITAQRLEEHLQGSLGDLSKQGFTASGQTRFVKTLSEFTAVLLSRSIAFGNASRANDTALEVTHDHVRSAAAAIQTQPDRQSKLAITGQAVEYICAACAGVSGGKLDQPWGIPAFAISLVLGLALFMVRIAGGRR